MKIADTTNKLVSIGNVAQNLRLADKYMEVYRSDRKRFVLAEEHKFLEPVIKYYATRAKGFSKYILKLRDEYPRISQEYEELNKMYRTVFTRAVQQDRRLRADYALNLAVKTRGDPPSFSERLSWVARREAEWAVGRREHLEKARNAVGGKLSRDETTVVLAEYWAEIDANINNTGVPEWGK